MEAILSVDWYVFFSFVLLLPILLLPAFIGCGESTLRLTAPHNHVTLSIRFKVEILELALRKPIERYISEASFDQVPIVASLQADYPFDVPKSEALVRDFPNIRVQVHSTPEVNSLVSQPENSYTFGATIQQDSDENDVLRDWIVVNPQFPNSMSLFELLFASTTDSESPDMVPMVISGFLLVGQNEVPLFEGIGNFQFPDDLSLDYVARFSLQQTEDILVAQESTQLASF